MRNKKILLITYYWPPAGGSGVQRWLYFANNLAEMGYDVCVITSKSKNYQLFDQELENYVSSKIKLIKISSFEPAKFFKSNNSNSDNINFDGLFNKIKLFIRANFFFPDSRKFWINKVVKTSIKYINSNEIDYLITSSPPFSLNIIGYKIKSKTNIKWISDCRDPWSDFFQFRIMPMSNYIFNKHLKWEQICLKSADTVIVTSPSLRNAYSKVNSNTYLINNGFEKYNEVNNSGLFNIVYSGVMKSSQNPIMLWKVLADLCKSNESFKNDLKIKLIGDFDSSIFKNKNIIELEKKVSFIGYASKLNLNTHLCESSVFLLCDINDSKGGNLIPGKFYDYLSYKIPIIAFSNKNSDTYNIVKETNSGNVFDFSNEFDLKNHILELYSNFKNNKLILNKNSSNKYLISNLTLELNKLLKKLI